MTKEPSLVIPCHLDKNSYINYNILKYFHLNKEIAG